MVDSSILGHIVSHRLSQSYEDVATQGLLYVLRRSEAARGAFARLTRELCPDLDGSLRFRLQAGEGGARPDLTGVNADGRTLLLIESKFWAGLTDKQPVGYLELLPDSDPALLLFIVPGARATSLWAEIEGRLTHAGQQSEAVDGTQPLLALTGTGRRVALVSWTRVLDTLELALSSDPPALADLRQLRGLCHAVEDRAFHPLAREELTDQRIPARMINYSDLVGEIIDHARGSGIVNCDRLRPGHDWHHTGRYFRFGGPNGAGAWIGVNHLAWRKRGRTPIWIEWAPGPFGQAGKVRDPLTKWARERGSLLIDEGNKLYLALDLKVGSERDAVVADAVNTLREIRDCLASVAADPAATPEDDDQAGKDDDAI